MMTQNEAARWLLSPKAQAMSKNEALAFVQTRCPEYDLLRRFLRNNGDDWDALEKIAVQAHE